MSASSEKAKQAAINAAAAIAELKARVAELEDEVGEGEGASTEFDEITEVLEGALAAEPFRPSRQ